MRVSHNYEQDSTYLIYYIYTLDFSTDSPRGLKVKLFIVIIAQTNSIYTYVIERLYKHAGFIDVIVFSILIVIYI